MDQRLLRKSILIALFEEKYPWFGCSSSPIFSLEHTIWMLKEVQSSPGWGYGAMDCSLMKNEENKMQLILEYTKVYYGYRDVTNSAEGRIYFLKIKLWAILVCPNRILVNFISSILFGKLLKDLWPIWVPMFLSFLWDEEFQNNFQEI